MIDIPGTYQTTFFSNNSDIAPSADSISAFLDLFRDKGFLPNTIQGIEITPAGPRPQMSLRLSPPDGAWDIEISARRINIKKNAIKPKGSNMGTVEDFIKEVVDFCGRIQRRFPRKANRLSLVTDGLLREMSEERFQQIYARLFQPVTFYVQNPPFEWELASVARVTKTINAGEEKFNVATRIKRIRGRLEDTSGIVPFDRIQLLFDINTFPAREPRFDIEAVSDFFLKAGELRAMLLKQLEEYFNG